MDTDSFIKRIPSAAVNPSFNINDTVINIGSITNPRLIIERLGISGYKNDLIYYIDKLLNLQKLYILTSTIKNIFNIVYNIIYPNY